MGDRDIKFGELGRYLCEVRAGQYWRLERLKSFDGFLAQEPGPVLYLAGEAPRQEGGGG